MGNSADYIEYITEQLAPLGDMKAKAMFGGHGIYCDGQMFALVAEDMLYLKVDDVSRPHFIADGLEPFRYEKKDGKSAVMSYYSIPSAALDDQDVLLEWARHGVSASLRAGRKKKTPKAKKKV